MAILAASLHSLTPCFNKTAIMDDRMGPCQYPLDV